MARRRAPGRPQLRTDGQPDALADPEHPAWSDLAQVEALLAHLGLTVRWLPGRDDVPVPDAAWRRFQIVRHAWAREHDMLVHGLPDMARMTELGVSAQRVSPRRLRGLPGGPLRRPGCCEVLGGARVGKVAV